LKKITLLSTIILCFTMILLSTVQATTVELDSYKKTVADFSAIDTDAVRAKIEKGDSFFLFTGRSTCPWCRKFVPVLNEIAKEEQITIFYLDSENTPTDDNLKAFRDEYGIASVPSLSYFSGGKYNKIQLKTTDAGYYNKATTKQAMSQYINAAKISNVKDSNDYKTVVKNFSLVTVARLRLKIKNGDSFFLFTGRSTCPWCRKFVPVLNEIAKEEKITIFYLDSENTAKDAKLKAFRDEYGIPYVPSLTYFDGNGYDHIQLETNDSGYYEKATIRQAMSEFLR